MTIMTVLYAAERILPDSLRCKVVAVRLGTARILSGETEATRAQRMALIAFLIRIISAGIAFVSQIMLARLMGEFDYGIFAFVWVMVILLGNMSCLGFHATVIRFLPGYKAAGDNQLIRGLTATARIFALVSASLMAAAGAAFLYFFGEMIPDYYLVPTFLGALILPMIALGDVLDGTARANGWPVSALSPTYIVRPLLILIYMLIAILAGEPHTATTAMVAGLAAAYTTTVLQLLLISKRLDYTFDRGKKTIHFSQWFRFALPIFVIDGIGFMMTNADVLVVGFYLPPDHVGIYFAAAKTIILVQFVFFAVKAAASPRFAALIAHNDREGLSTFAGQSARWTFWPSLGIGACVLLAGPLLLSLFGPAFTQGYSLMFILFAGFLAKASIGPAEALLNMTGHQKLCVGIYVATLVCGIILYLTLTPLYGLIGAAIATAAITVIETVLLHVAVRHTLGIVLFAFKFPFARADRKKAA